MCNNPSLALLEAAVGSVIIAWMVNAILIVWFQGSIFSSWRGWFEARQDLHWWAKLFTCSMCLGVHVSFWIVVILVLPWYVLTHTWPELFLLPFYWSGGFFGARAMNELLWSVNPVEE